MTQNTVADQLGGGLVDATAFDVGTARERSRQKRLRVLAVVLGLPCAFLWYRILSGAPFNVFALPNLPDDPYLLMLPLFLMAVLVLILALPLTAGRSPHLLFRPEDIDVSFDDVRGLDPVVNEVVRTLNTFLGYRLYRTQLGGNPRRGLLFEGPPGTGKTHLAKAMAKHAGVPFLFVSATSFQSMWYGATARKIRSYFRQLRRTARREGGAIGFVEELDAIATTRGALAASSHTAEPGGLALSAFSSDSTGGVVNELLVQLQSFDTPPLMTRIANGVIEALNAYLPAGRQLRRRPAPYHNLLLIAATNRAGSLDPALLRPGRFDRRLSFDLPAKDGRRALIDHFLATKAHDPELDRPARRDQLAQQTLGFTPVMLERLLDEALVVALGHGRDAFGWNDLQEARLVTEVGLGNPVTYTAHERQVVATHEAGHATVAYLAGTRRLEILSIIKRAGSLGLLAHGDLDEVYTRSRTELLALIDIALGGLCAEQLFFGETTTGPGSDLAVATKLAAEFVGVHGMGQSLVSLAAARSGSFNNVNLVGRVLADPYARPQVDEVLQNARTRVQRQLTDQHHLVEALRDALLEREELIGDEIMAVLDSAEVSRQRTRSRVGAQHATGPERVIDLR